MSKGMGNVVKVGDMVCIKTTRTCYETALVKCKVVGIDGERLNLTRFDNETRRYEGIDRSVVYHVDETLLAELENVTNKTRALQARVREILAKLQFPKVGETIKQDSAALPYATDILTVMNERATITNENVKICPKCGGGPLTPAPMFYHQPDSAHPRLSPKSTPMGIFLTCMKCHYMERKDGKSLGDAFKEQGIKS